MVIFLSGDHMKLYLKRDVSAGDISFSVLDECGREKYRVVSVKKKLSTRLNLSVTNTDGETAAKIRRFPLANAFVLRVGKSHVTFVIVPTKRGILSYFYGNNWHILGDVAAKNFTVIDVDKTLVLSHRRHSGYCELDIADGADELFCVAVSVCANMMNIIEKTALQAV